jgi:predicted nucleic acid-binding protein
MCIVIDTCALSVVFKSTDSAFAPVRKWILVGKGKMVFGGSTYTAELSKVGSILRFVAELSRQGKTVVLDKSAVDDAEKVIKEMEQSADFDDPHIVAIARVSRCRVVCTLDKRSDKFVRDRRFYAKGSRPSIYRAISHSHLLCEGNIVGECA